MSQQKEAQIKFYNTREDKDIDKVIGLENEVKVLGNIVYKMGQSFQKINMLNQNYKTSFVKPEFLKKAQRLNPRLYDIGCYNDNLALMLTPESDEVIRLVKESRSKLSDLIRPFDYAQLNNLYDLFFPQHEKSFAQRYFSERPHLKSNQLEDRVMLNTSQGKKQEVEDHRRNLSFVIIKGSRGTDLYSIILQDTSSPNLIFLMVKATSSQAWLWHRRISHLNFDTINLLSKNDIVIGLPKLKFVKDHLCSSYETPEVLIDFLILVQRGLHAQVRIVQTEKGTVFIKRIRVIGETIHANFDELPQMALDHVSSNPVPQCPMTVLEHDSLSPGPQSQENVPQAAGTSSTITTVDTPNQCQQQHTTPLNTQTTPEPTCQDPTQVPTVTSTKNINQAETITENAQVKDDEFINIFCTPVQERGEPSSRLVDSSNMHTFYQRHPSEHCWTKDHPLELVIRNPSHSVRTRRQLETDGEMYMFALTVSRIEPKNIKEAMADSA
uniref:Integrase, catalytic region, zinc finger, CCHC-type, peptidase aspartic, catalytic n=1 Tax=Tanacetum cinerariifolium TaxID=118510 RepID=A0A6L2LNK5_TANCI|nr:integrase, catalytic region, zinc finger, CCHC-type, peptidase aspartic, catalytic [Tanacetum cinerariifolium]